MLITKQEVNMTTLEKAKIEIVSEVFVRLGIEEVRLGMRKFKNLG